MQKYLKLKSKFIYDVALNTIGSLFLTIVSQLLLYPYLSSKLSSLQFGNLLTIMGVVNSIAVILGATVNNIKLIKNNSYINLKVDGDYHIIIRIMQSLALIIMIIVCVVLGNKVSLWELMLIIILSLLTMMRTYMGVYYRISLNYKLTLLHMVFTGFGYLIGLPLFKITNLWPIAFICGEISAFIFAALTTNYYYENRAKQFYSKKLSVIL